MESINRAPSRHEDSEISPEKQEILSLEATGNFLFSGSGADVAILEPRQAIDTEAGPDGEPAVFATNKADFAIFFAIVNGSNCEGEATRRAGRYHGVRDDGTAYDELDFGMSKATAEHLRNDASGWVYIFDKNQFTSHPTKEGIEFVSYVPVTPIRRIKVARRDMPKGIEIFD